MDTIGTVFEALDNGTYHAGAQRYTQAWLAEVWPDCRPHAALLVDPTTRSIRWVGRATGSRRITTLDRRVTIERVQTIDALPLDELRRELPKRHREALDGRGILGAGAARATVESLKRIRPAIATLIEALGHSVHIPADDLHAYEVLSQERDAIGLMLDFADIGREVLETARPMAGHQSFLESLPEYDSLEDPLIAHDATRFSGWQELPAVRVDWRSFTDGDRQVSIMNANRTPVERTTGVDLVYYNEDDMSFVLVQYKKMRRESSGRKVYRPDNQLDEELRRMRIIDSEASRSEGGNFRLYHRPCWIKLCDPNSRLANGKSLITGMYFAREQFEQVLTQSVGPRGGSRITWDGAPKHLCNTDFVKLVRDGWIGSEGCSTERIASIIRASLSRDHSVSLGVQRQISNT